MFITIEGGEGSGKSTLIKKLVTTLSSDGHQVVVTREPGGTPFGEVVRHLVLDPGHDFTIGARAEMMLFLSSRVQHIEEIIQPALDDGKVVVCDRFNDSTIAYQGSARNLGVDYVESLCNLACQNLQPNLTFFLDIAPDKAFERLQRDMDRMEGEKITFHERVRSGFKALQEKHPERVHIIDATQTPDEVYGKVSQILFTTLKSV